MTTVNTNNKTQKELEMTTELKTDQEKDIEYILMMNKYIDDKMSEDEIKEWEIKIQTWELFRIYYMVGLKKIELDGVPSPILKQSLKSLSNGCWNKEDICLLNITSFNNGEEDKEPTDWVKEQGHRTIGEKYRTLEYQSILYQIYMKMGIDKNQVEVK